MKEEFAKLQEEFQLYESQLEEAITFLLCIKDIILYKLNNNNYYKLLYFQGELK